MDKNGIILYSRNQLLIGKNYLGDEFQSLITPQIKRSYNDIIKRSLEGRSGAEDITFYGNTTTISYQPVLIDGKQLWTLFIGTPHILASDVNFLIGQQKNFSTLMVIIIGTIALGIAFLILSWNRRLEAAVNARTAELKEANNSLTKSNRLLAAANEQLKVHDKMQKEFINIAAHELRNPIQPIIGFSELLYSKIENQEHRRLLEEVILNARRLEKLARIMLDVTRIENKSLILKKEIVETGKVVRDIIDSYNRKLGEKNAVNKGKNLEQLMIIQNGVKDLEANFDKVRITEVICNILDNAVNFSHEGKIKVVLKKEKRDGQNFLLIKVKDTGPGIDPDILAKLFTKFASKSDMGTGLGLFISKGIVEAHGGKIWAENNPKKGATFSFTLPI
jgi:signal transduction histidine kinase